MRISYLLSIVWHVLAKNARLGLLAMPLPQTTLALCCMLALATGTLRTHAVPSRSSPIAVSANLLVSVNPDANTISVFDVSADAPVKLGEVAVGREPSSVAISPGGGTAYVANAADGTVSVVNLATRAQVALVNVGAEPMELALSPNGTRLYVANSASGSLMVLNTAAVTPTVVATVDLSAFGAAPRAIAVTDDGDADDTDETIFVTLFYAQLRPGKTFLEEGQDDQREGRVVAISAATNTVLGGPNPVALGPIASAGFNSNGQLAPGNSLTPAIPSTNPQTFTTPTAAFPNQLASLAIRPSDSRAYVISTAASPNGPVRFNQNVHGLISVFNTGTRNEITAGQTGAGVRQTAPLNLNQGVNLATTPAPRLFNSNPTAIAWRPDGSDAWITIQQSDVLLRMTVDANGIPTINAPLVAGPSTIVRVDLQGGTIPGKAPRGVVINGAGTRAYVLNYVSRSISVVDISNPTAPSIAASVQATALPAPNTPDATAQLGAEMFFSGRGPKDGLSSEGWGSCASCHPNGRSDNVTWMFDAGPRQTIALDGTFGPTHQKALQRILNWSAVRDEVHDFELNSRGVSGGRGLIDDDRLFLAFGGASGATPNDTNLVEQFHQFTGAVGTVNDLTGQALPTLPSARRDFAIATLEDGRVFIIGGRDGTGSGTLINDANTVLEFNTRSNTFRTRSATGFTPRHSLGAAAVRTSAGLRIYAVGGYASTTGTTLPVGTVEEYNPATDTWRTVATLPQAAAQFGITVAGGVNTADPLQLIHIVGGNAGSESAPSLVAATFSVQRFQADPAGPGVWSNFAVTGLTIRRNHGVAAVLRGVATRILVIGGQDAAGTVMDTVEEYTNAAVPAAVVTPHTSLPAPRARFGIAGTLSSQQIYVIGGVNGAGADQTTVFEYSIANNGPVAGPPGTPSGTSVTRAILSAARSGLQVSTPPGVVNLLPFANTARSATQDAMAEFVRLRLRPAKAPVPASDPNALAGRTLFGTTGLVVPGFSCATCHGGANWTRSVVDYTAPPSPGTGLGLGDQQVIGAELRTTATQPNSPGPLTPPQAPGVLLNVGTFTQNSPGGRVNEIRVNPADVSQAATPLGANGLNIPSLLSLHETGPYFYSGLAQTLSEVLDGSRDGNGGVRHHFVLSATQRAQLAAFLRSIDDTTPIFPGAPGETIITCSSNIVTECTGGLTPVTYSVTATNANESVPVTCVPPSGTGFRIGTSNVVCTASGATAPCSFTVTVQDTTPPTVTCNSNITTQATSAAGAVVTYISSASDPCGIASFDCVPASGGTFAPGATTVTCTAVGGARNTNSCSFTVTVEQRNTPPSFSCGTNVISLENSGLVSITNWVTDILPYSIVYGSTFDMLPPGSTVNGSASVSGGVLHLTDAVNSQQGFFATPALAAPVESFTATFNALIGGGTCCGDRTADGWSLSFGNDIPNSFTAEEGGGSGIIVSFDSWDNAGSDDAQTAPDVDIKVGGNVIAYQAFDGLREGGRTPSGPLITDPATGLPMTYKTGSSFVPVRVHLDADGTLDVDFKGVRVFDNLQTGYRPIAGTRLVFGARTGGANDNHWIDDLQVETLLVDAPPGEAGQTVSFSVTTDHPEYFSALPAVSPDGTLTYTPAPNACGTATVVVVAQDNGGTGFDGGDTSAPCTNMITITCVNDCPAASNLVVSVDQNVPINSQLSAFDADGDALQYNVTQAPAHGLLTVQMQTGAFNYSPNRDYCGPDSFKFTVRDAGCTSPEATVNITVNCTGLRTRKRQVLAEVIAFKATVTDDDDRDKLDDVIEDLRESLANSLWLDDNHPASKKVFDEEKDAVEEIEDILEDAEDGDTDIPVSVLQDWIDRLVAIDRQLAVISVDEAEARGASPHKIAKARDEIEDGDKDAARGKFDKAIKHYRDAWKNTVKLNINRVLIAASPAGFQAHFEGLPGFALRFEGLPGEQYILQVSDDLIHWTPLVSLTAGPSGAIDYVDTDALNHPKRFYQWIKP